MGVKNILSLQVYFKGIFNQHKYTGFPPKFQKKNLGEKNKNLGKNYQKFLSKIKEICNISLILF